MQLSALRGLRWTSLSPTPPRRRSQLCWIKNHGTPPGHHHLLRCKRERTDNPASHSAACLQPGCRNVGTRGHPSWCGLFRMQVMCVCVCGLPGSQAQTALQSPTATCLANKGGGRRPTLLLHPSLSVSARDFPGCDSLQALSVRVGSKVAELSVSLVTGYWSSELTRCFSW